jgi:hypothetical protein
MKRSGRDESIQVVTHLWTKAMLEICVAIFITTSKHALCFLLLFMSSLQQNWRKGQKRFCLEARGSWEERGGQGGSGEKWLKQYMHI